MKIAAFLYSCPPFRTVGGEMMTLRLLQHSAEQGHDVSVVVRTLSEPMMFGDVKLVPGHTTSNQPALRVFNECDLLVTHPELASVPSRYTARLMRVPWVGIVHNLGKSTVRGLVFKPNMSIVANSHKTAELLIESGVTGERPLTVIYPPAVAPVAPVEGLPQSFCTMVNISPAKGAATLQALAEDLPEVPFLAVLGGHGEQEPPKGVDNVTLYGHFSGLGMPFGLSRVVISPSLDETYGMVVCEATVAGIPVVASDIPAHREALGDSAILLDPEDRDGWASAVYTLMTDDDAWLDASLRTAEHAGVLADRMATTYAKWDRLIHHLALSPTDE